MKRRTRLKALMALVAAFGLAGPAHAQQLSSDEIVKLITGITVDTVRGRWDNPTTYTFKADGTLEGKTKHHKRGLETDQGKWWTTKDGMYCRQWNSWSRERKRCSFLVLQKDGYTIKVLDRDRDELKEWVIK